MVRSFRCRKTEQLCEEGKCDRKGQYSIRVNDKWRICFTWSDFCPENVEIVDYH